MTPGFGRRSRERPTAPVIWALSNRSPRCLATSARNFTPQLHPATSPRDFTPRLHPPTSPSEWTLHPRSNRGEVFVSRVKWSGASGPHGRPVRCSPADAAYLGRVEDRQTERPARGVIATEGHVEVEASLGRLPGDDHRVPAPGPCSRSRPHGHPDRLDQRQRRVSDNNGMRRAAPLDGHARPGQPPSLSSQSRWRRATAARTPPHTLR